MLGSGFKDLRMELQATTLPESFLVLENTYLATGRFRIQSLGSN